nr:nucleotidyltransferase family protein [Spiractinospora alimapuensis]
MTVRIAGLLLAAGSGSRLGTPKATVRLGGERLVDRGVRTLSDGGCAPIVVVTGAAPDLTVPGARRVHNPLWDTGMGSSLRAGLDAMPEGATATVVALVDQPFVTAPVVSRLLRAYADGASVAVAAYEGAPRNPVLIGREHWAAVGESAAGDVGARAFLRANPDLVTYVECGDLADPSDIDTVEDLARARAAVNLFD